MLAFIITVLSGVTLAFLLWSGRLLYNAVRELIHTVKDSEGKNQRDHQRVINAVGLVEGQVTAHRREFENYVKQHEGRHDTIDAILTSRK